jgi:hypothetical protein
MPSLFPSRATERKERDDRARVVGPVSTTAPENTRACSARAQPTYAQPLPFSSYREKGERRPSSGTRVDVGDSPWKHTGLFSPCPTPSLLELQRERRETTKLEYLQTNSTRNCYFFSGIFEIWISRPGQTNRHHCCFYI